MMEHTPDSVTEHVFDPPLVRGTLIKRYKRFLADVTLDDGREITAHCMNTGGMTGLAAPGSEIWLTPHNNPKRKLQWTWEIASDNGQLVGVNTQLPNRLVEAAVTAGTLPGLDGYETVRREVKYGEKSRIDLLLSQHPDDQRLCYLEIKSTTLGLGQGMAAFPDAKTERGRRHLEELAAMVALGHRAVIFFLVQRSDAVLFKPADHVDPLYGRILRRVVDEGVEAIAWRVSVQPQRISFANRLPIHL